MPFLILHISCILSVSVLLLFSPSWANQFMIIDTFSSLYIFIMNMCLTPISKLIQSLCISGTFLLKISCFNNCPLTLVLHALLLWFWQDLLSLAARVMDPITTWFMVCIMLCSLVICVIYNSLQVCLSRLPYLSLPCWVLCILSISKSAFVRLLTSDIIWVVSKKILFLIH